LCSFIHGFGIVFSALYNRRSQDRRGCPPPPCARCAGCAITTPGTQASSGALPTAWGSPRSLRSAHRRPVRCGTAQIVSPGSRSGSMAYGMPLAAGSCGFLKERGRGHAERVRNLHERPHRGVAAAALQVGQIAALDRRPLRKPLLRPVLREAQSLDPPREVAEDVGFGDGQPFIFPKPPLRCCMIGVTIGGRRTACPIRRFIRPTLLSRPTVPTGLERLEERLSPPCSS